MEISVDSMLGSANFDRISIGDLVSWKDITENDPDQYGIVLSKYISNLKNRKILILNYIIYQEPLRLKFCNGRKTFKGNTLAQLGCNNQYHL